MLKWIPNSKKITRKKHFADYIIYISIFMIVAYTVTALILQFKGLMEVSATLTTCWYGFWTAEIIALAAIKNTKTKEAKRNEYSPKKHTESEQ